jgi:flagellar biosynthesis protein FlhF
MFIKTFEGTQISDVMRDIKKEFGSSATILSKTERILPDNKTKIISIRAASSKTQPSPTMPDDYGSVKLLDQKIDLLNEKITEIAKHYTIKTDLFYFEKQLNQIKAILDEREPISEFESLPDSIKEPIKHLYRSGISTDILLKAVSSINTQMAHISSVDEQDFYTNLLTWLQKQILIAEPIQKQEFSTVFHMILGTSGSGKTTCIAKLAHLLKNDFRVHLVCFDNHRVSSTDQLKLLASILNIPFTQLSNPTELLNLPLQQKDIVLIDTEGASLKSNHLIKELLPFRNLGLPIQTHLVLPLTHQSSVLDETIKFYLEIGIQNLIFSKLDDTWKQGEMFNQMHRWSIPISYLSIGTQIPNDIIKATRNIILDNILDKT